MRVVVTGATGNVGTSVLRALSGDPDVTLIRGVARRVPDTLMPGVEWHRADVGADDLVRVFTGADAVIHLAWLIQPSRRLDVARRVNVDGSRAVFEAVAAAEVPVLAYASSVGAYSRGPKESPVDESWPTDGIETSFYSRHKAEVERALYSFEADHPGVRVVRLRPALIFKGEAAAEIRRLFAGPFLPTALIRRRLVPAVPRLPGLRFQAVHSDDVGEAFRLAVKGGASGPFNLAADPVLDAQALASALGARAVSLPPALVRAAAGLTWRLRLQPSPPGWLDMGLQVPLMDSSRARRELGWAPQATADQALRELLEGMGQGRGYPTPPLDPAAGGPLRVRELATGLGGRSF
jgi:nucleoside-diphosphate-sugar epimerase